MTIQQVISELQWCCQGKYNIRKYVVNYLQESLSSNEPIQLITIWCLSRGLIKRFSGGKYIALDTEVKAIKDLVWCQSLFSHAGLMVNHFIYLIGSGVENGQIPEDIKENYNLMLSRLIDDYKLDALIEIRQPAPPNLIFLDSSDGLVNNPAVIKEVNRRLFLASKNKYFLTKKQAYIEAVSSIAVKINEARQLVDEFGDFILTPLEFVERYQFHNWGVPDFNDRLLPVVQPYPWRPK